MDDGRFIDLEGWVVNFINIVIIMMFNVGVERIMEVIMNINVYGFKEEVY